MTNIYRTMRNYREQIIAGSIGLGMIIGGVIIEDHHDKKKLEPFTRAPYVELFSLEEIAHTQYETEKHTYLMRCDFNKGTFTPSQDLTEKIKTIEDLASMADLSMAQADSVYHWHARQFDEFYSGSLAFMIPGSIILFMVGISRPKKKMKAVSIKNASTEG